MTYYAGLNDNNAVHEWELFAGQLKKDKLEWYEYWQTLDMRESFENGERTLTEKQWEIVKKTDEIVRAKLLNVLIEFERVQEYRDLGEQRPKKYWWWHLE
ncbi:MAG: hypothetical protein QME58_01745 [Bacteroidota bacterium]|nr:hypothetical protein [Bacteroidota bacterium]